MKIDITKDIDNYYIAILLKVLQSERVDRPNDLIKAFRKEIKKGK